MNPLTQSKNTTILPILIALTLACFGLSPKARAVCQEGCLTNQNTALGEDALLNNTTGAVNTATGFEALFSNTTGYSNTASGWRALYSNTSASDNTATGSNALFSNTIGIGNTANGIRTLYSNTTGGANTASGEYALISNTTGNFNTANGANALQNNTTGSDNTANGNQALLSNTTANNNTATGAYALWSNTTGDSNTATGIGALYSNTFAVDNTATGADALFSNTIGNFNTATGRSALQSNTTGNNNVATGWGALLNNTTGRNNTATGQRAMRSNTTGSFNIALGANAGDSLTTGSNNIDIGNEGRAGEANTIRIGRGGTHANTFIAGISGVIVAGGVGVIIDNNGKLGTVVSSERFKHEIKPMDKASEAILALRPVTFRYKQELDPDGIPQFGLVAEDVEKVNPDLVVRDKQGKPYTVRYEAVNAMLLNEFLKEHRKVQEQEATITQLNKDFRTTVTQLTARLDEQAAQIQKVSAQLEASKPASQVVNNP